MANVLNEFLHGVSRGFQDAAFATFKRRRSSVREDINQSFVTELPKGGGGFATGGTEGEQQTSGEEVKGKADVTPSQRSTTDDLQEL